MLNLSFDEKKSIAVSHCKQMDIMNFKIDCINYKFKNVKSKLSNYDSLSDVNHLDNLANWEFHHVELKYYKLKDKLLDIAKKETIEIFEDHNIDYFIKYYNITFYKDTKIFEIEI